jgi:hypothetical protein
MLWKAAWHKRAAARYKLLSRKFTLFLEGSLTMTATRKQHSTKRRTTRKPTEVQPKLVEALYMALELSWSEWKLAFATGPTDNARLKSIGARNTPPMYKACKLGEMDNTSCCRS